MTHYTDDAPVYYVDHQTRKVCRIRLHQDEDAMSPRDDDGNLTVMATIDRDYSSPDHLDSRGRPTHTDAAARTDLRTILPAEYVNRDEDGYDTLDARYVNKWMALQSALGRSNVLAFAYLDRNGYDGTLTVTFPENTGARNANAYNYRKQYHDGLVWITRERWAGHMGTDEPVYTTTLPNGETSTYTPRKAIEAEVEEYNKWLRGEYVGWTMEVPRVMAEILAGKPVDSEDWTVEWVTGESVWGYDDPDYAWGEAMADARVTDEMETDRDTAETLVIDWEADRLEIKQ